MRPLPLSRTPREQRELHELARLFHEHGDVERPTYAVTDGETPSFTPEPTMVTTPEPRAPIPQRAFDSLRRIPASVINMRILEVKATRAESRSLNEDVSAFHDKIWELETLFRYKVGMLLASPLLKVVAWWDDGFWDTRLMSNTGQTFREVDHDIPGVALYREYSNSHDRIVSKNVEIILVVGKKPDEGGFLRRWKGKYGREGKSLWVFSRAALPQAVEQRRGGGDE